MIITTILIEKKNVFKLELFGLLKTHPSCNFNRTLFQLANYSNRIKIINDTINAFNSFYTLYKEIASKEDIQSFQKHRKFHTEKLQASFVELFLFRNKCLPYIPAKIMHKEYDFKQDFETFLDNTFFPYNLPRIYK